MNINIIHNITKYLDISPEDSYKLYGTDRFCTKTHKYRVLTNKKKYPYINTYKIHDKNYKKNISKCDRIKTLCIDSRYFSLLDYHMPFVEKIIFKKYYCCDLLLKFPNLKSLTINNGGDGCKLELKGHANFLDTLELINYTPLYDIFDINKDLKVKKLIIRDSGLRSYKFPDNLKELHIFNSVLVECKVSKNTKIYKDDKLIN